MNLFILTLFSLFLIVHSEGEISEDQKNADTSLYDSFLTGFYDDNYEGVNWNAPAKQKVSNKNRRVNSNKNNNNQSKNNKKSKNNRAEHKPIKVEYKVAEPEIIGYVGEEPKNYKGEYNYKLIGREGLGFDLRTASAYGLAAPLTPKLLDVVGQNYLKEKKNQDIVYPSFF